MLYKSTLPKSHLLSFHTHDLEASNGYVIPVPEHHPAIVGDESILVLVVLQVAPY